MNIKILNYTGVTFVIKWGTTRDKIMCNSEKTIQLDTSSARLTRFFARYKSVPDSPIRIKGQINIVFSSSKLDNTLILGAFTDGIPKYIGCVTVNDVGRYLYSEYDRKVLQQKYPSARFYNIPVELHFSNGLISKIKKMYYITFNQSHCENRDGPMCDKILGIPVLILIIIALISIIIGVFIATGIAYIIIKKEGIP